MLHLVATILIINKKRGKEKGKGKKKGKRKKRWKEESLRKLDAQTDARTHGHSGDFMLCPMLCIDWTDKNSVEGHSAIPNPSAPIGRETPPHTHCSSVPHTSRS